jgi:hypothetical protein
MAEISLEAWRKYFFKYSLRRKHYSDLFPVTPAPWRLSIWQSSLQKEFHLTLSFCWCRHFTEISEWESMLQHRIKLAGHNGQPLIPSLTWCIKKKTVWPWCYSRFLLHILFLSAQKKPFVFKVSKIPLSLDRLFSAWLFNIDLL